MNEYDDDDDDDDEPDIVLQCAVSWCTSDVTSSSRFTVPESTSGQTPTRRCVYSGRKCADTVGTVPVPAGWPFPRC